MTIEPTISIVDGDAVARASIADLIGSMGVLARAYSSAEEFLAAFERSPGDCLLADTQLRGMSGLQLLEAVSGPTDRIPVILIMRPGDVRAAVRAMALGAVTVLQKPCRELDLSDAVRLALILGRRWRQSEARLREIRARRDALTAGEVAVLDLILKGRMNKEIARALGIGLRTVEARRHSIMVKFSAHSLVELLRSTWEMQSVGVQLRAQPWDDSEFGNGRRRSTVNH